VEAAEAVGLSRDGGPEQLTDEVVGLVCETVRPARTDGRGRAWMALEENVELIAGWIEQEVPLSKVQVRRPAEGWGCRIARCGAGSGAGPHRNGAAHDAQRD
jgi:hypothetical protein